MKKPNLKTVSLIAVLGIAGLLTAGAAEAAEVRVILTNSTPNQIIAPPVVASHAPTTRLFRIGAPASPGLALLAEDGDGSMLLDELMAKPGVLDMAVGGGMLMPGASMEFTIEVNGAHPVISAVGMLVTTNDAFFGLDRLDVMGGRWWRNVTVPAYDAGSEANNEACTHIPGPPCGNPGVRATDGAEGFVSVHTGIHGVGDIDPAAWDWHNPVVTVEVVRN